MTSYDHNMKTVKIEGLRTRVLDYTNGEGKDPETLAAEIQSMIESENESFVASDEDVISFWLADHDRSMMDSSASLAEDPSAWAGTWTNMKTVEGSLAKLSGKSQASELTTPRFKQAVAICILQALSKLMADRPRVADGPRDTAIKDDSSDDGLFKVPLNRKKE